MNFYQLTQTFHVNFCSFDKHVGLHFFEGLFDQILFSQCSTIYLILILFGNQQTPPKFFSEQTVLTVKYTPS